MITFDTHKDKVVPLDQKARMKLVFEWVKTGHLNTTEFIKFIEFIATDLPVDPDNWVPWFGGKCPVEPTAKVIYRMRDGDIEVSPRRADDLDWGRCGSGPADWEITAYMIINSKDTK